MNLELAVLGLVLLAIASILVHTLATGVPPMPTSPRVRRAMLASLPADLAGTIVELGSGWGTLTLPLARRYPDCRVVGYEISMFPWAISRMRQSFARLPNLEIRRANFFRAQLVNAALVVCYLSPDVMGKLKAKLEAELGPRAVVLSGFFRVPGWQAATVRELGDMHASRVYLYRMADQAGSRARPELRLP